MAHGDHLNEDGRRIREALLDMVDNGIPLRRSIAIVLEHVNFGQMEAGTIERAAKEVIKTKEKP